MSEVIDQTKVKMKAALEHLKEELKSIRTSRANPSMLDHVTVEIYGSPMRLRDVASITTPESRQLLITPFDPQNKNSICKSIEKANLGFTPMVDGNTVRINIPQMDENARKKMVDLSHKRREEAKVSIRQVRRDANDSIKKQKTNGDIPEDQMKKLEKTIQELTDKACKDADDLTDKKEKEIMTI